MRSGVVLAGWIVALGAVLGLPAASQAVCYSQNFEAVVAAVLGRSWWLRTTQ
jgi:hypothetical protein